MKLIKTLIFFVLLSAISISCYASQQWHPLISGEKSYITFTINGNASETINTDNFDKVKGWWIWAVETRSSSATTGWDLAIVGNTTGYVIGGTDLADRVSASTERVDSIIWPVKELFTLTTTNTDDIVIINIEFIK